MTSGRWSVLIAIALGAAFLACTSAMGQSQPSQNDIVNSLPSTNFSADRAIDRSGIPRPAPGFANAEFFNREDRPCKS
jgi:hypothetical protein